MFKLTAPPSSTTMLTMAGGHEIAPWAGFVITQRPLDRRP